jgi:hypothetical protein
VIAYVSPDRKWRVECTATTISVYTTDPRGGRGRALAYRCVVLTDLEPWLREHAGVGLADLIEQSAA